MSVLVLSLRSFPCGPRPQPNLFIWPSTSECLRITALIKGIKGQTEGKRVTPLQFHLMMRSYLIKIHIKQRWELFHFLKRTFCTGGGGDGRKGDKEIVSIVSITPSPLRLISNGNAKSRHVEGISEA